MAKPSSASRVVLSELSVRPVVDGAERAAWDRLMDARHYLGFRCLFGGGVRIAGSFHAAGWEVGLTAGAGEPARSRLPL